MSANAPPAARHEGAEAPQRAGFLSNKWFILALFCLIQVSTTADNTALSNAISAMVISFDTSVAALQVANTIYPLVAGAAMVVAGMLGLLWGWKRLLRLGLVLLVAGEATAAVSPNIVVFTYGARILTGLGASMAIPAILGLIAHLYSGREQAVAFGAIGAANGVAAAAGPLGSGLVIVGLGWRWAFVILAALFGLALFGTVGLREKHDRKAGMRFDPVGALLVALSLVGLVYGLLQMNSWGLIEPAHAPFTVFGISPCPFLLVASALVFWLFLTWERYREQQGLSALMPDVFLKSPVVRSGLYMTAVVFFVMGSFSFVVITFLQIVIGYNAIQTGAVFTVFAVGMVLFSLGTPMVMKNTSPRRICQAGILVLGFSSLGLAYGLEYSATDVRLLLGLFLAGMGSGLIASQSSVVITQAIPQSLAEQSGGVQGTARNLGQAIGIALVGVVLIGSLTASVKDQTAMSERLLAETKQRVSLVREVPFLSNKQVEAILERADWPRRDRAALIEINAKGRLRAARLSVLTIGGIVLLFLFSTRGLPHRRGKDETAQT